MSEWVKAEREVKEAKEIGKYIHDYSYINEEKSKQTDKKLRDLISKELKKSKDLLFNIMELAYKEEVDRVANEIQSVRDEIDIFLNEISIIKSKWNKISKEGYIKIIKSDLTLIRNVKQLNEILNIIYNQVLSSKAKDLIRKGEELRKYIYQLRGVFKERGDVCYA